MDGALALGDLVVADRVLALDGTSRALGAAGTLVPDAALTRALEGDATGAVVSADSYAAPADGALVRDLQTAAVLAAARRHGVPAAAVLLVTALPGAERLSGEEALHAAEERLGRVGARALGAA
jgi:nucleoside phosphorylase